VEAARDAALAAERQAAPSAATPSADEADTKPVMLPADEGAGARLMRLKGIGPETASVLRLEAFHRSFGNRREVAAYAGLTPTPWQSGGIDTEQGISKAGNGRLRRTMVQLAGTALPSLPPADRCAMVLAAQPATERPERLVSRAGARGAWPDQAHRHRGIGKEAIDRALAVRHPGLGAERRRVETSEGGLTHRPKRDPIRGSASG
jgi:transposase